MDSQVPIFDVKFIQDYFEPEQQELKSGDCLFNENEPNDFVYFILTGAVKVSKKKWAIGITFPNEFVGITSCISEGDTYTFSAKASCASKVLKIKKEIFKKVLLENPKFSRFIIEVLCKRIRLTDLKTSSFLDLPPERRVIVELLNNLKDIQGKLISQISMKDLSELTGVSIRSVKKIVDHFIEDGIISMPHAGQFILIDKKRLERLIDVA